MLSIAQCTMYIPFRISSMLLWIYRVTQKEWDFYDDLKLFKYDNGPYTWSPYMVAYLVRIPGSYTWSVYQVRIPGPYTWSVYLVRIPGPYTWSVYLVRIPGPYTQSVYLVCIPGPYTYCFKSVCDPSHLSINRDERNASKWECKSLYLMQSHW